MTLLELIDHTTARLQAAQLSYGHGTACAHDESAWLVLHALGLPLDTDLLGPAGAQAVSEAQIAAASALLHARISTRKPLAYLIEQAWLQGLCFHVDERAIIPRSLIAEVLAQGSLSPWLPADPLRVLDLCTGNGSLAIMAALLWPGAQVHAVDISADALAVARINVQQYALAERITLLQGDGLSACAAASAQPYDLILCNPPYVNSGSMAALPAEYRAEPALALAGGHDGMDFIRPLLAQAAPWLGPEGLLVLEIGHERPHFEAAFARLNPIWLDTSAGGDHVLLLSRHMLADA